MAAKVSGLAKEIAKSLATYTNEVVEDIQEAKKQVSKESVAQLRSSSPKDTGEYATGWRAKKVGRAYVIHNATHYQLTHLLENGHANVGGGRTAPRVHIRPVEQKAIEDFEQRVRKAVQR